ncbi:LysR family transcriptional regulator [Corynebacterium gallinarum]|uniref:LysR family transcriptional regulator n=1 Tax=Corynebacterium gallinarum TaxID=2762214 RepID=A0A8I0HPK0_9CORY|nr:LysR substrate-binding domain-containing protein [Corynebacterium gallinarum]MBD8029798.1 LysR family transcriptional regulator [Corynebacterium gallinarum]
MIEARQLKYFLAVASARNFSRAADDLHISQPPLSRQIRLLEKQIGTALFDRSSQGVELTAAGAFLAERAPTLLNELEEIERDVRAIGEGSMGVLRLGFVGTATHQLMPQLLKQITTQLPEVEVRVSGEKLTPDLERLLSTRQLDAAVLRPPVSSPDIELESFGVDDFMLAVHPGHPLYDHEGTIPFTDLVEHPIIAFKEGSAAEQIIRHAAHQVGFELTVAHHAPETSTVLALVSAGLGIALVPHGSIPQPMGTLRMREISGGPTIGLALAWLRGNRSPILRQLKPLLDTATLHARNIQQEEHHQSGQD